MSNELTAVSVRDINFNLHTYNRSLELCARMNYETEVLDFIDALSASDVFYDLGAAEGRFSLYAASRGMTVVAFEPEKRNYEVFLENMKINQQAAKHIHLYNLAVGAKNEISTINIGQPWAGGHQKVVATAAGRVDLNFNFSESQAITVVTLDEYIQTENIPFPTAIKVDIDGSEVPFMNGAKKTLSDPRVKKVIFEMCVSDDNYDYLIKCMQECGFQEQARFGIPNEPNLYNIIFKREG